MAEPAQLTPEQQMIDMLTIAVFNIITALEDDPGIRPEAQQMLANIAGVLHSERANYREHRNAATD